MKILIIAASLALGTVAVGKTVQFMHAAQAVLDNASSGAAR